jgi:hypothetical protein
MLERKCETKKTRILAEPQLSPSSRQHACPNVPETPEFVTNDNMVIIPHHSYSPDLAPCDFALFPKLKMKLKEQCFETVCDI